MRDKDGVGLGDVEGGDSGYGSLEKDYVSNTTTRSSLNGRGGMTKQAVVPNLTKYLNASLMGLSRTMHEQAVKKKTKMRKGSVKLGKKMKRGVKEARSPVKSKVFSRSQRKDQ